MRIVVASDHAGVDMKQIVVEHCHQLALHVTDMGTNSEASVDYPALAHELARWILEGRADRGVLICGTGIGMSMAANRHRGIRAALCHDAFTAEVARRHNDANVLCLGGRTTGPAVATQILDIFVSAPFDGGRHLRRIAHLDPEEGEA